jgi:nitrite reductase/ring-hydroxylating ferredoxin subunit
MKWGAKTDSYKEDVMGWLRALEEKELPDGQRLVMDVGGRKLLIIHYNKSIYAMTNICPHLGLPLSLGRIFVEDGICALQCPWHHSSFDLANGNVTAWSPWPPGVGRVLGTLKREKTLAVYPVKVEDGGIWVDVG